MQRRPCVVWMRLSSASKPRSISESAPPWFHSLPVPTRRVAAGVLFEIIAANAPRSSNNQLKLGQFDALSRQLAPEKAIQNELATSGMSRAHRAHARFWVTAVSRGRKRVIIKGAISTSH
eukprot:scaffold105737_cov44-Phaeocystis_antarctica.AAC.1